LGPGDVSEVITQLLPHHAAVGVRGIAAPPLDARDERFRGRRKPQANELATGFTRDRLDRGTLLLLGEDRIDDDGMAGSEGAARLVLDNVVDALRRADAVMLAIETLRLRDAEQAFALNVATQVKRAGSRPDKRGNDVGERRFARPR
jgi:hypothetical protein